MSGSACVWSWKQNIKFSVELHLTPQEGVLPLLDALREKREPFFETFCSEPQNQSNVYIASHRKSPEDRLSSSEEHQIYILNNAVQQPAAISSEDKIKVQTFLFLYRIASVYILEDRFSHPGCFPHITAHVNT